MYIHIQCTVYRVPCFYSLMTDRCHSERLIEIERELENEIIEIKAILARRKTEIETRSKLPPLCFLCPDLHQGKRSERSRGPTHVAATLYWGLRRSCCGAFAFSCCSLLRPFGVAFYSPRPLFAVFAVLRSFVRSFCSAVRTSTCKGKSQR